MNDRQKVSSALNMLRDLKWRKESSWLTNAMRIDEIIKMLEMPNEDHMADAGVPGAAAPASASPRQRAGLSDRLIALLGKPSGNARRPKAHALIKK